jgi:hypothetical protein
MSSRISLIIYIGTETRDIKAIAEQAAQILEMDVHVSHPNLVGLSNQGSLHLAVEDNDYTDLRDVDPDGNYPFIVSFEELPFETFTTSEDQTQYAWKTFNTLKQSSSFDLVFTIEHEIIEIHKFSQRNSE